MSADKRLYACSLCFGLLSLALNSNANAKYRRVDRKDIETGDFEARAPKVRYRTLLENREVEGWIVAATDSSIVVFMKDGGYAAVTPRTTGPQGIPDGSGREDVRGYPRIPGRKLQQIPGQPLPRFT